MRTDTVVTLLSASDILLAGGKAAALSELLHAGANVPNGFVVTTQAAASSVDNLADDILRHFDDLGSPMVAVRSSGTGEDSRDASWAGQFDTYLNVSRDELLEKIKSCFDSAHSARSRAYGSQKDVTNPSAAVLVQQMVQSEVSGVAFSVHPVTQDTDQTVIEAGLGLGEAVVSGDITPDTYIVSKTSGHILERHISRQDRQLVHKDDANTWQPTGAMGNNQKLSDKAIMELTAQIKRIEAHFARPQDIEWAWMDSKLYILQSRPITTLP